MADIGMELKLKRIRNRMRQSDVSAATGIPQCVISRVENGNGNDEAAQMLREYFEAETKPTEE